MRHTFTILSLFVEISEDYNITCEGGVAPDNIVIIQLVNIE